MGNATKGAPESNAVKHSHSVIPVFAGAIQNQATQMVDARALHAFLAVGKRFPSWITERITEYGFVQNTDFLTVHTLSVPKSGSSKARPQKCIDYHLTLDMAKELSMVEKNEKGREARRYFIEVEREFFTHQNKAPVVSNGCAQTVQRAFQGRTITFALIDGAPWASAAHISSALNMSSSDRLVRPLPTHQKRRIQRSPNASLWMIDETAALHAADYCRTEQAEPYREWLEEVFRDLRTTAAIPVADVHPSSNVEQQFRKSLSMTRFLCSFDFEGKIHLHEVGSNALVIQPERLANYIADPEGAPRGTLGDILEAVGRRMKRYVENA